MALSAWLESTSWQSFSAISDLDTAKWLSERCGSYTQNIVSFSQQARSGGGKGGGGVSVSASTAALAERVTQACAIPTIGIGAGPKCSGQVLVLHDMLEIYPGRKARFVRNFMAGSPSIQAAIESYVRAVKDESFPAPEHCF